MREGKRGRGRVGVHCAREARGAGRVLAEVGVHWEGRGVREGVALGAVSCVASMGKFGLELEMGMGEGTERGGEAYGLSGIRAAGPFLEGVDCLL